MSLLKKSIVGGICLSSIHLVWILLVISEWAQATLDFIFKLHMLNSPFKVQPFDISLAISLLALTFFMGSLYVLGFYSIKAIFSKK
jgi:hypothetical protein